MAEGGNVPELGGYDYEFTSKVPEYWECLVCQLTLKDPVQIEKCGHRLCSICMESLLRRPSPTCPADRQPLSREKIFSDTGCHRQIQDLTVKCPHSGCWWTGELRAVEKHQSECLFKVVKCPNSGCAMMFIKRDMKTHETSECSWRKVNCEYCQESVIMNQKQKHFDICLKFPVLCANKCSVRDIPREKLEVHIRDECPATEVRCEYKNLGCEEVFPRSDAKSHSQTQIESHLNLALRGLEATQHQVHELVTVVKDQSQQIERMISNDKEQRQQIERQSQQIEQQSQQIESLMSKDKELTQQIGQLMSKDKEKSQKIETLMSTIQDQSQQIGPLISKDEKQSTLGEKLVSTAVTHLRPRQRVQRVPTNLIHLTPFEWKIPNFWLLCESANLGLESSSVVSEPFYLLQGGYKYLMKIEIASDVIEWELIVTLWMYIKNVPGEFDDSLSWPCKEKVRVTLVNQNAPMVNWKNKSGLIDFEKDVEPCSRPLHDDHHKYRVIRTVRSLTPSFFKDGTLLIRVNRE